MSEAKIVSLAAFREALAERFPEAVRAPERVWAAGWAALDEAGGGLKHGAVTEMCSAPGLGGLFLDRLLAAVARAGSFAGLVDCGRTFDPGSHEAATFSRLLAVFCTTAKQGVQATDLLLRDGNLPLVLLDLQAVSLRSLGRIPASTWHRFQRLVEKSGGALVVLTPQPVVEAARVRISLQGAWDLSAMKRPRRELLGSLRVQVFQRGRGQVPLPETFVRSA
jgi:hypothetical protein